MSMLKQARNFQPRWKTEKELQRENRMATKPNPNKQVVIKAIDDVQNVIRNLQKMKVVNPKLTRAIQFLGRGTGELHMLSQEIPGPYKVDFNKSS